MGEKKRKRWGEERESDAGEKKDGWTDRKLVTETKEKMGIKETNKLQREGGDERI